ncbi:MAG: hypothetical protein RLZZ555_633 [Pseudomonadota bacterium]|jgi:hypothetical protein
MPDTLDMETSTIILTVLAVTLAVVTVYAWHLDNEKRDVALLGAFSGLFSVSAAISFAL